MERGNTTNILLAAAQDCGLVDAYAGDEPLLRLYTRKLLKPGWAGSKNQAERSYIRRAKAALGLHRANPPAQHRFRAKQLGARRQERPQRPLPAGSRGPNEERAA